MDLRERLAQLDRLTRRPGDPPAGGHPDGNPEALARVLGLEPVPDHPHLFIRHETEDVSPPGKVVPSLDGLFTRVPEYPLDHEELLFLDTETTGLVGGTGTLAFLVGLARWRGRVLDVTQIILTDPAGEAGLLRLVEEAGHGMRAVVTYNGAAFDLPLLRTRGIMNRLRDLLAPLHGLDLVVPARRLWARTLTDCRQQTLEKEICLLERGAGDIAGRDIPAAWFAFLRGEDSGGMACILEHNLRDMRGMALIWHKVLEQGALAAGGPRPGHGCREWTEGWSLARVAFRQGRSDGVKGWLNWALDGQIPKSNVHEARELLTAFLKDGIRLGKRLQDTDLLEKIITLGLEYRPGSKELHREAAILHERRRGDLDTALAHALQCQEPARIARLRARIRRRDESKGNRGRT